MNLTVTLGHTYYLTPNGEFWTSSSLGNAFWHRYLSIYDLVRVVTRVAVVEKPEPSWIRVDGDGVEVIPVTAFKGPVQFLFASRKVRRQLREALVDSALILRAPSQLANVAMTHVKATRQPYGVEIVGDPYEVFARGASKHPLRWVFQKYFTSRTQQIVKDAAVVGYVTEFSLQRRYPAAPTAHTANYSTIDLHGSAYSDRRHCFADRSLHCVSVGSMAQMYKGFDTLLYALQSVRNHGLPITLTLVGDGQYRKELEQLASDLGVKEFVEFTGNLPSGQPVRNHLDRSSLFVLSSRTEGLPRAMIEAMARGLPCVGSRVGGIPELLPDQDMVPPNDPSALAEKLLEVAKNPKRLAEMSARNQERAMDYHSDVLKARREEMYTRLKEITHEWQGERTV